MYPKLKEHGVTMVEMMIAMATTAVIALAVSEMLKVTSKAVVDIDLRSRADITLRFSIDKMATRILNANEFELTTSTEIRFRADSITDPNYFRFDDIDGDGIVNIEDPDDDNDATLIQPPTAQWRVGYDLKDDDDDNDLQIDMVWRIYLSTTDRAIYSDYSKNGESWGNHIETLVTNHVSTSIFSFYGSENDLLSQDGATLDLDDNGIIGADEIEAIVNGGNGNNILDTAFERNRIVTVGIFLNQDVNDDGIVDSELNTDVMPPQLYIKRRP